MVTGRVSIDGTIYNFGTNGVLVMDYTYLAYCGTAVYRESPYSISGSWSITVNRQKNIVTVYKGSTPVRALWCSTGLNNATPLGTTYIRDKLSTWTLNGPSYGFYCHHIWSDILFHSIPYEKQNDHYSMYLGAFNQLGQQASLLFSHDLIVGSNLRNLQFPGQILPLFYHHFRYSLRMSV